MSSKSKRKYLTTISEVLFQGSRSTKLTVDWQPRAWQLAVVCAVRLVLMIVIVSNSWSEKELSKIFHHLFFTSFTDKRPQGIHGGPVFFSVRNWTVCLKPLTHQTDTKELHSCALPQKAAIEHTGKTTVGSQRACQVMCLGDIQSVVINTYVLIIYPHLIVTK